MKQREIKFRAWNGQYMIDSSYGDWISFDGVAYTEAVKYDTPNIEIEKAKNYILMQGTGLFDRHGKECYEGDILALDYPLGDRENEMDHLPITVTISFQNGCFWFTGEGYTDCNWHFYNASDREIIGNIYQNPDLLKWLINS